MSSLASGDSTRLCLSRNSAAALTDLISAVSFLDLCLAVGVSYANGVSLSGRFPLRKIPKRTPIISATTRARILRASLVEMERFIFIEIPPCWLSYWLVGGPVGRVVWYRIQRTYAVFTFGPREGNNPDDGRIVRVQNSWLLPLTFGPSFTFVFCVTIGMIVCSGL